VGRWRRACSTKPLQSVQGWDHETKLRVFGLGEFIPLMCLPMRVLPAAFFSHLAYPMFNYLFRWSDRNWKVCARHACLRLSTDIGWAPRCVWSKS
jgi:hypothetical protein